MEVRPRSKNGMRVIVGNLGNSNNVDYNKLCAILYYINPVFYGTSRPSRPCLILFMEPHPGGKTYSCCSMMLRLRGYSIFWSIYKTIKHVHIFLGCYIAPVPNISKATRKDHLQAKRALAKSESSPEAEPEPLPLEPELPSLGSRLHAAGTSQAAAGDGPGGPGV